MTTEHVLVDNINSEDTVPTLLQELMAFGERAGAKVTFHQDADELVFLWDEWDREGYGHHLWHEDGVWYFGESQPQSRGEYKRFTELSTPDFDIAARWLIHKVGGAARIELHMHALKIPVDGGFEPEDFAPGWRYEYANDKYVHLFTPEGHLLPVTMTDSPPFLPVDAVVLSHLMGFTPQQLLTSYQDPNGHPYLTQYLHKRKAIIDPYFAPRRSTTSPTSGLETLTFYAHRGGAIIRKYLDTNAPATGEGNHYLHHFWHDNDQWHYGTSTERNPRTHTPPTPRTALLSTPDRDIALRWLIHETMNAARFYSKMHPLVIPTDLAPGWTTTINDSATGTLTGHLITPEGTPLDMTMTLTSLEAPELAALSHLMTHTPQELITSIQDPYARPHLTPYLHENTHLTEIGLPLPNPIPPLEHA